MSPSTGRRRLLKTAAIPTALLSRQSIHRTPRTPSLLAAYCFPFQLLEAGVLVQRLEIWSGADRFHPSQGAELSSAYLKMRVPGGAEPRCCPKHLDMSSDSHTLDKVAPGTCVCTLLCRWRGPTQDSQLGGWPMK